MALSINNNKDNDERWMRHALSLAQQAQQQGEVPVGAVLVADDVILGEGFNQSIGRSDATAHAEIMAIRQASNRQSNYRLATGTLYVSLEPCLMCAGAMLHARIKRCVFGAYDPKTGVIESCDQLFAKPYALHRIAYTGGVLADQCGALLQDFFKQKRKKAWEQFCCEEA